MDKINWSILLSIISPIVMAISLIAAIAVYKDRLDTLTNYFTPQWLEEQGRLKERVEENQHEIDNLQQLLRDEFIIQKKEEATE